MASLSGRIRLPLTANDYIELLPVSYVSINHEGVTAMYRKYNSVELQALRRLPSSLKSKKHKWEMRTNPYDPRLVWVRNPEGGWIECTWREDSSFRQPFSATIWADARRIATEGVVDAHGTPLPVENIALLLSLQKKSFSAARKQESRRMAALERSAAEGTPMPAGESPAISGGAQTSLDTAESAPSPTDEDGSERPIIHLGTFHDRKES